MKYKLRSYGAVKSRNSLLMLWPLFLIASCSAYRPQISLAKPMPVSQNLLVKNPLPLDADTITFVRPTGPLPGSVIGYWDGTIKFIVKDDPGAWVANELSSGLEQAGYRVEKVMMLDEARTSLLIVVKVTEISYRIKDSETQARLLVNVVIDKDHRQVLSRIYAGIVAGPSLPSELGVNLWKADAEQKLDQAITQLLNQALPDLTAFLAHAT